MTMKARFMVRQTAPRGAPGFVRIIGGKWRGRRVLVGASARPTPSRLRETIFNCVRDWENRRVLDLFAGSGALGLEAMSRGATKIVLVETDSGSLSRMRQTLRNFGAENSAELQIAQIDAVAFLREAAARGDTFRFYFHRRALRVFGGRRRSRFAGRERAFGFRRQNLFRNRRRAQSRSGGILDLSAGFGRRGAVADFDASESGLAPPRRFRARFGGGDK